MKRHTFVAFSEFIVSAAGEAFTSQELDELLSQSDQLGIQVIVTSATNNGTVQVQIEHCGDGRSWVSKQSAPEVGGVGGASVTAGQVSTAYGYDSGVLPSLPYVRLRVRLATTTSAHVAVLVTGRDHAQLPRLRILDTVAYSGGWTLRQFGYKSCVENAQGFWDLELCKHKYICNDPNFERCLEKASMKSGYAKVVAKEKCIDKCDPAAPNYWAQAVQEQAKKAKAVAYGEVVPGTVILGEVVPASVVYGEILPGGSPAHHGPAVDQGGDEEQSPKQSPWEKD